MRAIFVNEFERGLKPDQSLDVGKKRFERDPKAHIKNLETHKTEDQQMQEDLMKRYVFIGRPAYKAVTVNGKKYHEEILHIENLYQIDPYENSDLTAALMLKIRATQQGEGSRAWKVLIDSWMHDEKTTMDDDISDDLRQYIDENKETY